MKNNLLALLIFMLLAQIVVTLGSGCAQIGAPTGGARDTSAPMLVKAIPELNTLNFNGNKITLTFNEYIELQDLQSNLLISPLQKNMPVIKSNLRSIYITLKDTLLSNTTYTINLGNAVKDINEGNIYKNLQYTFSTGNSIDSLQLSGKVTLAETGKVDSTLIALLYLNPVDSSVTSRKPDYIAKVDGKGDFVFTHLPRASARVYVLKDGDGGKTYNSKSELFAFYDTDLNTTNAIAPVILYAYAEEKSMKESKVEKKQSKEKKLSFSNNLTGPKKDLLEPLKLTFNTSIKKLDVKSIVLTDTSFKVLPNTNITFDSSQGIITIDYKWIPETRLSIIVPKEAVEAEEGKTLSKSDTLYFITKSISDYGNLVLRFNNLDTSKKIVVQFVTDNQVKYAYPIIGNEWSNKIFPPGEYEVRILYDSNNDGVWTAGKYKEKLQPEKIIVLSQKISVKANWDNERIIDLPID